MPDWYRDHNISPEAAGDDAYLEWAQDNGLRVDAAGNVTDPAEDTRLPDADVTFPADSPSGTGLDAWEF